MTLDRISPPAAAPLMNVSLPNFEKADLSNGISVYLLPYGSTPVVEVKAIFKAGKGYQSKTGLANYTARNIFEGTANKTSLQISQELDSFGAWLNHDVDSQYISINLSTVSTHLTETLPLLQEVLTQPSFPEREFENMKQRGLQRLAVSSQKTSYQARRRFDHLMFGESHPYGMHTGPDELKQILHEDIRSHYQDYIYPGNFFITVVGSYNKSEVLALLENLFGNLETRESNHKPNSAQQEAPIPKAGVYKVPRPGMQSTLRMGHRGFNRSHPDAYKMMVVNTILGGYFGSRLMKNIREEKGYTYGIYSGWISMKHDGYFVIQCDLANEYVEPAINEIYKEINLLIQEGVGEEELNLVKNYMFGQSISQRETPFQLGDILRFALTYDLSFAELDRKFEVIRQITAAEVQELAAKYIRPQDMLTVISGQAEN